MSIPAGPKTRYPSVQAARGDSEAMGQLSQVSGYQLRALQECAEELRSLQEQVRTPSAA